MRSKSHEQKDGAEKTVRDIRRATRRRYSAEEKIRIVLEGLRGEDSIPTLGQVWNKLPAKVNEAVIELALAEPTRSAREVAILFTERYRYFVSEATVYRLLKAHDLITSPAFIVLKAAGRFSHPTMAPNQLWQTDFTYLKVIGWGWFYLSTVLDHYSRYILAWKLCTTMGSRDVAETLEQALGASGLDGVSVRHRPRYHPMTQGKIERWHRSLKNEVLLENYYLSGDLRRRIDAFVRYYNGERYHGSLDNLTPEDVDLGRGQQILDRRRKIKQQTLERRRRLHYRRQAA